MNTTPKPEPRYWTIAYRKPRANRFVRRDLALTWEHATREADAFRRANPGLQVFYTANRRAELNGYVIPEDIGNILTETGRRVRVADLDDSAAPTLTAPGTPPWEPYDGQGELVCNAGGTCRQPVKWQRNAPWPLPVYGCDTHAGKAEPEPEPEPEPGVTILDRTEADGVAAEDTLITWQGDDPEPFTIDGLAACGASVDGGRCGRAPGHDGHPHIAEPGTEPRTATILARNLKAGHVCVWRDNEGRPDYSDVTDVRQVIGMVQVKLDHGWQRGWLLDAPVEVLADVDAQRIAARLGAGSCQYSAAHQAAQVPATTVIDCGRVGQVQACQPCADFYARMAGSPTAAVPALVARTLNRAAGRG